MTSPDLLQLLLKVSLASTVTCVLVLLLRGPVRRRLSAGAAYGLWVMLPLAALAVLLPAPRTVVLVNPVAGAVGQVLPAPGSVSGGWGLAGSLLLLWAVGALLMAALLCWQQRRFVRALGPLQALGNGCWQGADVPGLPALVGVLRPRIVLPAGFDHRYSADEQALIVLHERIHLRRGDGWINALVALWCCLFWFNPLFVLAQRCLRADQEFSCDEVVIAQRGDARRSYASAMLKTSLALSPLPVGCHWQDIHPLKERIVMLKREQQTPLQRHLAGFCVTTVVLLVSTMAWAAQPAQPARPVASDAGQANGRINVEVDALGSATVGAQARSMSAPVYPTAAFAQSQAGKVVLEIEVGADGKPSAIDVVESTPTGVFDASTVAAAWNWQFSPAMDDGKPVAGRVRVPVHFDLDETVTQSDNSGS